MAKGKTVSVEKMLGKMSPQARKEFAEQYNGGLGSGKTPEAYKKSIAPKKETTAKKTTSKKK